MALPSVSVSAQPAKRKAHTKSRRGCRNCKLRRVKCDETKPHCRTCTSSRYWCNYDFHAPDLKPLLQGSDHGRVQNPKQKKTFPRSSPVALLTPVLDTAFVVADANASIELDKASMKRLDHFRASTVYTFAHPKMADVYQNGILRLGFSHPHLMHVMLATSAAHIRYLCAPDHRRSAFVPETYHKTQSAALLNQKLSQPIQPEDRDPLWATAATLSILSLCGDDASSSEEVWPLKSSNSGGHDLEWLHLSKGKKVVWELVEPLRPGGMFSSLAKEYAEISTPPPIAGIEGIPSALVRLCKLDASSTAANNPYFNQVHALSQLQRLPRGQANLGSAMRFVGHMQPSFVSLLQEKEPVALLVLASWYVEVRHAAWWLDHRATVEGEAICSYLLRYHWSNPVVAEFLLPEPKANFALDCAPYDDFGKISTRKLVAKA